MIVSQASVGHFSPDDPPVDEAVFGELRAFGAPFMSRLLRLYVDETESGLSQLRLALALADAPAVASIAHSIRGSCGLLGGQRLAAACARLERTATTGGLFGSQEALGQIEIEHEELQRALTQRMTTIA
ncbi:MAG: Hpt domain-containing protein [Gaiellaceae bacterium]